MLSPNSSPLKVPAFTTWTALIMGLFLWSWALNHGEEPFLIPVKCQFLLPAHGDTENPGKELFLHQKFLNRGLQTGSGMAGSGRRRVWVFPSHPSQLLSCLPHSRRSGPCLGTPGGSSPLGESIPPQAKHPSFFGQNPSCTPQHRTPQLIPCTLRKRRQNVCMCQARYVHVCGLGMGDLLPSLYTVK